MKKTYIYNVKTKKLHIKGNCRYCSDKEKLLYPDYDFFASEDDAVRKYGRAVSMCKACLKRNDKKG